MVRIANYVPPSFKKKKIEEDVEAGHMCRGEQKGVICKRWREISREVSWIIEKKHINRAEGLNMIWTKILAGAEGLLKEAR